MTSKRELRLIAQNRRDTLSEAERTAKSAWIAARLFAHPAFINADAVCCYVSFRSEVDTAPVLRRVLSDKKVLFCPKVLDVPSARMEFFRITAPVDDLHAGNMGICEPDGTTQSLTEWMLRGGKEKQVLIVMPGLAFNAGLDRIGYGGGFYDTYLATMNEDVSTVALAFDVQVFDQTFPTEAHDKRPQSLLTESSESRGQVP